MKYILVLCLSIWVATVVHAGSISKVVVFGDSLSDNGNIYEYSNHKMPAAPWYFKGRYTNGLVWADRLEAQFFLRSSQQHLFNYAFGGAGVLRKQGASFVLNQEIDSYLLAHQSKADPDSLFIIWIGANDYLLKSDADETEVNRVVTHIQANVQRLVDHGAAHILMINLPNLGHSPFARELDMVDQLSRISVRHNQLLQQVFSDLQSQYADVHWLYFDANQLFNEMRNQPGVYGLVNTVDKCYEIIPKAAAPNNIVTSVQKNSFSRNDCLGYLFVDYLHPTAAVHQIMADRILALLVDSGLRADEA